MLIRGITLSLAALVAIGALAIPAEADHRKKQRRVIYDHYYGGPEVVRGVPGLRLFFGDYALTEEEFDQLYGTGREFDESYYEPEPVPAPKPKKKPVAKASKEPAKDTKEAPKKPVNTAAIDTGEKAPKPAASAMSCDKASSIVSGYGFSGIKPQTCSGKVYAFNATRDGKPFAIKLDPSSGELTEVKKLQ